MKNTSILKNEIARTLKEMSEEQSLRNITVCALCTRCNINRGTFYYHFVDIYDLIIWIFEQEVGTPLENYLRDNDANNWSGITEACLREMYKSRSFYCQAVSMEGQNCLREYMHKRNEECWQVLADKYIRVRYGSISCSNEYIGFLVKYTAQSVCNMTIAWIEDGMSIPVEVLSKMDDVATKGIYGVIESLESHFSKE